MPSAFQRRRELSGIIAGGDQQPGGAGGNENREAALAGAEQGNPWHLKIVRPGKPERPKADRNR